MLTSITPLGERGRQRNWTTTVIAYIVGSLAGGGLAGLVAGALGAALPMALDPQFAAWMSAVALMVVFADEVGWIALTPIGKRQVNEDWLDEFRGWVVGLGFGFQLGLGMVTIVTSLAVPAALLLASLTQSPLWGLLIGTTFGLARALPILQTGRVASPSGLAALHRRHDAMARLIRLSVAAAAIPLAILTVVA